MTPEELFQTIRSFCIENNDTERALRQSRFFTEGYDGYGIPSKTIESFAKELFQTHQSDLKLIIKTARLIVVQNKFEEIQTIILLLSQLKKQFRSGTFAEIEFWFENGIHNWAHTDQICAQIISPLFTQQKIPLEYFSCWRESLNKFQKRAVPVSFRTLLKLDTIDLNRILLFLEPMMKEQEKTVQKGMGWFLRDAWKKHPDPIEEFLYKWKDKSGKILLSYATEKIPSDKKSSFR